MRVSQARLGIAAVAALLVCAACGFKGPLYLPERNAAVVTHPAPAEGTPAPGQVQPRGAKEKSKSTTPSAPERTPSASPSPP